MRSETCLSDFAIDSLLADELSGGETEAARRHASACEACSTRIEATTRQREAFMREAPPLDLPQARPLRRPGARLAGASAVLALAAAVLLFFGLRKNELPAGERTKGRARIGIVVKHGEAVRTTAPGDPVSPGDRLRFVYTSSEPTHLAILGVDGSGHASIYVAENAQDPKNARAERVEAGADVALPATFALDDTPGAETFYAFFCDAPVAVEPMRLALEARRDEPPPSCFVDRITLRKEGP